MVNKNVWILAVYYAFVYMSVGSFSSYIGVYFTQAGISHTQIGFLTSIGAALGLLAQPLWGLAGDRSRTKNRVLLVCTFCSCIAIWLVPLAGTMFVPLLLAMALFSLFQIAIAPLSDAITLELASKGIVRFTSIRTFGSVGYAFISVLAGWLFTKHLELIFLVTSALMLGCFFLIFGIPKVAGHQSGTNKVKLIEMFKNRQLIVLYVYTLLHSISIGFLWAFQAIYGKEQGISMQVIGIGLAIGSFSQFPFMIFFQNLYDRFGIRKILLLSGMIHTVRWSLYAVGLTPFTYVLSWILHGGTYILFYLCLAEYVNKYVVKELKVSGQMLNSLIQLTMGSIVGGMLGGLYAARFGFQNAFLMLMLIGAVATAGFYLVSRRFHMFEHVRHTAVETRSISHTEESL